jgi:hypothetical protein
MSLSSQTVAGQFTAESATQNEDHHADIKQTGLISRFVRKYLFSFYLSCHFQKTDFPPNLPRRFMFKHV